jgi:hypothetical protein
MQSLAKDASKRYPTANDMLIGLTRALPPSMRPSTDEEVAEFLRALLPDRLEKRKLAIRGALEAADRREAGKSTAHVSPTEAPHDEPATILEGLVSSREVTPSAEGHTSLPGATTREAIALLRDSGRAPRRSLLSMGLSAALVIAVGAIVALLLSRRVTPVSPLVSAQPTAATPVTVTHEMAPLPQDPNEPAVKPEEPLPPVPSDSVAPPQVIRTTPRARGHRTTTSAVKPPKPLNSASGTTEPRTGPFVSPIRNPGF